MSDNDNLEFYKIYNKYKEIYSRDENLVNSYVSESLKTHSVIIEAIGEIAQYLNKEQSSAAKAARDELSIVLQGLRKSLNSSVLLKKEHGEIMHDNLEMFESIIMLVQNLSPRIARPDLEGEERGQQ
ncbi:hypothetical protein LB044_002372 [Vibrio fluvialis]|nr:hypothetical protein [Vibrio fluvialis]